MKRNYIFSEKHDNLIGSILLIASAIFYLGDKVKFYALAAVLGALVVTCGVMGWL